MLGLRTERPSEVNDRILNAAGLLRAPELRSLDAIHLATANELGDELGALVTYDDRMVAAAKRADANLANELREARRGGA